MKVLEEKKLKGLKKEFLIEIPFSELSKTKREKLESISTKVKIAGFRHVIFIYEFSVTMLNVGSRNSTRHCIKE